MTDTCNEIEKREEREAVVRQKLAEKPGPGPGLTASGPGLTQASSSSSSSSSSLTCGVQLYRWMSLQLLRAGVVDVERGSVGVDIPPRGRSGYGNNEGVFSSRSDTNGVGKNEKTWGKGDKGDRKGRGGIPIIKSGLKSESGSVPGSVLGSGLGLGLGLGLESPSFLVHPLDLSDIITIHQPTYQSQLPFPHTIVDHLFNPTLVRACAREFPSSQNHSITHSLPLLSPGWGQRMGQSNQHLKRHLNTEMLMGKHCRMLLQYMKSSTFIGTVYHTL